MTKISGPYAVALAGLVAAGLVLWFALDSLPPARHAKLVFEIAKAAVQVFPLAFFGVVVAELVRSRDARRAVEQRRVDFLRGFLRDVVLAYNRTKATRRSLRGAGLGMSGHGPLTDAHLRELDERLHSLSEAQLDLERLKREARARGDIFQKPEPVTAALEGLEKYVNGVIKDWERGRPNLREGMPVYSLAEWPAYWSFVADQEGGGTFGVPAGHIEVIEAWIWPALLAPAG